jgi:hypothetical protein
LVAFDLDRFAMTRNGKSHKLLLGIWLLFCGSIVGALFFAIELTAGPPYDPLVPVLVGVAAIPFVWILSSGWIDADLFRRALRRQAGEDGTQNF